MGLYVFNCDVLVARGHGRRRAHRLGARLRPRHPAAPGRRASGCSPTTSRPTPCPTCTSSSAATGATSARIDAYWQAVRGPDLGGAGVQPLQPARGRSSPPFYPNPPAKFVFADREHNRVGIATDSMVSEGCIISGGHVDRSILEPAGARQQLRASERVDPLRRRRGRPARPRQARHHRQGRQRPAPA